MTTLQEMYIDELDLFYDPRLEDYARFYADCEVPARGSAAL